MGLFKALTLHSVDILYIWTFKTGILWTALFLWDKQTSPCGTKSCICAWQRQHPLFLHFPPLAWSLQSLKPPSSKGQSIHLFLSEPITARLHPQPPMFILSPVYLCGCGCVVCVCSHPYTLCISSSLCHLAFPVTLCYIHTPSHLTVSLALPLFLRVKHQRPLWLCDRSLSQILQSSALYVCVHCTVQIPSDSIYILASETPRPPPKRPRCSLW